jgi:predicted nicotinamide N-methyase
MMIVAQIGAGTALPGVVAAKIGAAVVLTDREDQPQVTFARKPNLKYQFIFGVLWICAMRSI